MQTTESQSEVQNSQQQIELHHHIDETAKLSGLPEAIFKRIDGEMSLTFEFETKEKKVKIASGIPSILIVSVLYLILQHFRP